MSRWHLMGPWYTLDIEDARREARRPPMTAPPDQKTYVGGEVPQVGDYVESAKGVRGQVIKVTKNMVEFPVPGGVSTVPIASTRLLQRQ